MNNLRLLGLSTLSALVIAFAPNLAEAQNYPPPPPPGPGPRATPPPMAPQPGPPGPQMGVGGFFPRLGLYGGFGMGIGNLTFDCPGCEQDSFGAIGINGDIGWRFSPKVGLSLDMLVGAAPRDDLYIYGVGPYDGVISQATVTIGVQLWVAPQFWLKGGLGGATYQVQLEDADEPIETVEGNAVMVAAGYEILSSPSFSLDLAARASAGFYEDFDITTFAVTLSANWHSLLRSYRY